MVSNLASVMILASFLLLLTTVHGRTSIPPRELDETSSNTSSLDSGTTDPNDASALMTLIYTYPGLYGVYFPLLTSDPCAPPKLAWITCSNDTIHRVTALDLAGQSLLLPLPDFSSMDALESIDLQSNSLFGPIPDFLGTFPKLTYLNLANNMFSGPIPESLTNNTKLKLIVSGNPGLCSPTGCAPPPPPPDFGFPVTPSTGDPQTPTVAGGDFDLPDTRKTQKKKKSKVPVILGSTITPSLLITVFGGVYAARRHRRNVDAAVAEAPVGAGAT